MSSRASSQAGRDARLIDVTSTWKPTWINAADGNQLRSYGTRDAKLEIGNDTLQVTIQRGTSRFVLVFAVMFLPIFGALIFYFVPNQQERIAFVCLSIFCGLATFTVIYALMRYHENLGDYLEVNRSLKTIRLPRQNLEFPFSQVVGFQWICGPTKNDGTINNVDLNLLIRESDVTMRYHIMGNPPRKMVEEIVRFSGIGLDEINVGWRGDRNRDANST